MRLGVPFVLCAVVLGLPTRALAVPGCMQGATCAPLEVLPCDDACRSDFCVGEPGGPPLCASADCIPCLDGDPTGCPEILVGNQHVVGSFEVGECVYRFGDCRFGISLSRPGAAPEACFASSPGVASFLFGDCDGDGILNRVEGPGQICRLQRFTGPGLLEAVEACPAAGAGLCAIYDGPYRGSVPEGALGTIAGYACEGDDDCPRAPRGVVPRCVSHPTGPSVCYEGPTCDPLIDACFEWIGPAADVLGWPEAAFAAGDCDLDGTPNGRERERCSPVVVEWSAVEPALLASGRCMGDVDCPPLVPSCSVSVGVCFRGGVVGVACDHDERCAGLDPSGSECAPIETLSASGEALSVCVPSAPADDDCGARVRSCFAMGGDPSRSYADGDCDDDGRTNAVDPHVCTPELDAAVIWEDAGESLEDASASLEASVPGADADLDAAAAPHARFGGSGCQCRAAHATAPRPWWAASVALFGALGLVRARRRRSGRYAATMQ